jgi:hypothetical protein
VDRHVLPPENGWNTAKKGKFDGLSKKVCWQGTDDSLGWLCVIVRFELGLGAK